MAASWGDGTVPGLSVMGGLATTESRDERCFGLGSDHEQEQVKRECPEVRCCRRVGDGDLRSDEVGVPGEPRVSVDEGAHPCSGVVG